MEFARFALHCPHAFSSVRKFSPLRLSASALTIGLFFSVFTLAGIGQAAEPLQAQPSRVFLGSLAYGETEGKRLQRSVVVTHPPGDWVPVRVDLSKAPGVDVRWERTGPTTLRLDLEIDTAAFTSGQPYGALVKRWVRLETPLAEAPQVLVPILGMTSVNATERDFGVFQFRGQARWQGWWATPNIAGSVLAVVAVFAAGVMGWFATRSAGVSPALSGIMPGSGKSEQTKSGGTPDLAGKMPALHRSKASLWGAGVGGLVALLSFWGLTITYSRGAWVACAAGLGMLLLLMRGRRIPLTVLVLVWGVMLAAMPEGLSRAGSTVQVQEDKSIGNRLRVWTGALQMMAEHPVSGVGAGKFGEVFPRLYQKTGHKESYSTAISDWFTWAAERGVGVVGLWTGLTAFLLGWGMLRAWHDPGTATAPFTAALLTLAMACAFSTLGFVREIQLLWGFLVAGIMGAGLGIRQIPKAGAGQDVQPDGQDARATIGKRQITRPWAMAGACCILACVLWWGAGQWALGRLPARTASFPSPAGPVWVVQPRHGEAKGIVWVFPGRQEDESVHLRTTLRPLAARGWVVVGALRPDVRLTTLRQAEAAAGIDSSLPRHWAGHREGAAAAWQALGSASSEDLPQSLALFGFSAPEWESPPPAPVPFLRVVHSRWDDQASFNAVFRWAARARAAGLTVEARWMDDEVSRNGPMWQDWLGWIASSDEVMR
jgi:O-antigen ligase